MLHVGERIHISLIDEILLLDWCEELHCYLVVVEGSSPHVTISTATDKTAQLELLEVEHRGGWRLDEVLWLVRVFLGTKRQAVDEVA